MSDWSAFFQLPEWRQYRKRQVEKVGKIIEEYLYGGITGRKGTRNIEAMDGALKMARDLLRLPEELARNEKIRELLDLQLVEDMGNLSKFLIRNRVNADE